MLSRIYCLMNAWARRPCRHLFRAGGDGKDFAEFAFGLDGEGAAADFAVGGEKLARDGGVELKLAVLAAVGALDGCGVLHA